MELESTLGHEFALDSLPHTTYNWQEVIIFPIVHFQPHHGV